MNELNEEQPLKLLKTLAIGLSLQATESLREKPSSVILLNDYLRHGWEQLCYQCFQRGELPPLTLPEFVRWLHKPVAEWNGIGDSLRQQNVDGILLEDGSPTLWCDELGGNLAKESNPRLALDDENFRNLYAVCRELGDTVLYTAARTFIVQHPILTDPFIDLLNNPDWELIRAPLKACYESVPRRCNHHTQIVCCPYCGWALEWKQDQARCYPEGDCAERAGDLSQSTETVAYNANILRTKAGVQRYVVAPEIVLIKLYKSLTQKRALHCTLYPGLDAYDLQIRFPNGSIWAVDVKDHRNAARLATDLNQKPFRHDPKWDHAFYIFPTDRGDAVYQNTFENFWTAQKSVSFMNLTQFIRKVNRELER